jgi:outer membrane protein assembly factor BamB
MRRFMPSIFSVLGLMTLTACTNMVGCNGSNPPPAQWLAYRNNPGRYGWQILDSKVANAGNVIASLHVNWKSPGTGWTGPSMPGAFRASPIVFNNTVFIGDIDGYFWALNASDGSYKWRYPTGSGAPLTGSCGSGGNGSWGHYGIQSSASYISVNGTDALMFGAPDPDQTVDSGNGSARLWVLNASTGALMWKSDVVANLPNCTTGAPGQIHERITYSSPLVFGNMAYVGVHDAADNPVQKGRLVAVDLTTHHLVTAGFPFYVVGTPLDMTCGGVCGGGVWNSPAYDGKGIVFTTGNVCGANKYDSATGKFQTCETEPSPDHSLSMVNIDPDSGALNWEFRAVPFQLDNDPDWAAGPTSMLTSCGQFTASVQKDGWTYAIDSGTGSCKWQFPPTAASCKFDPKTVMERGDDDYKQPGAAWGDYLFIQTGGWAMTDPSTGYANGYGRVHALDACQSSDNLRVRWIYDIPSGDKGSGYPMGAPTVTNGVVFVTTSAGHVIALADPSTGVAPAGFRCSNTDFGPPSATWASDCVSAGYIIVAVPASIDVKLDDGGNAVGMRMEPAIALDNLFVATDKGHVYALQP